MALPKYFNRAAGSLANMSTTAVVEPSERTELLMRRRK